MTVKDLQKLIDWIDTNVPKITQELYNEETGSYEIMCFVEFNELMKRLGQYVVEEEKCTADLDYKVEYNRLSAQVVDLNGQISVLKDTENSMNRKLARYEGAISMVELIYGRNFI